jgi:hypothetical protein
MFFFVEPLSGIEPESPAYETGALPLSYGGEKLALFWRRREDSNLHRAVNGRLLYL